MTAPNSMVISLQIGKLHGGRWNLESASPALPDSEKPGLFRVNISISQLYGQFLLNGSNEFSFQRSIICLYYFNRSRMNGGGLLLHPVFCKSVYVTTKAYKININIPAELKSQKTQSASLLTDRIDGENVVRICSDSDKLLNLEPVIEADRILPPTALSKRLLLETEVSFVMLVKKSFSSSKMNTVIL